MARASGGSKTELQPPSPRPSRRGSGSGPGGEQEEEAQKSYSTILFQEISAGIHELERPASGLLLSGLSAGLDASLSLLLMAVMLTLTRGVLPDPVVEMLVANMYAVGFIFVVLGRSELFTEHTALAVVPVLSGAATVRQLGRLWALVYVSNLVGATAFAALAVWVGPGLGIATLEAFGEIAHGLVNPPSWAIVASGVLAGWMMGLLSWLVNASRDTVSQVLFVWLVTASIGFLHLHHVVVGTAEVLAGVFAGQGVSVGDFGRFLLCATVGNILGGSFFVALLKFAHASQTADKG